ncbi:type IVB secretion system protein IcmH/DotU [Cupriavidus sp. NPDC089707]|uniref:type IVB secretion system protein IcmH/DotU n=1 Tax=Cupriavidus sp. NPDC089707 TaxID=3363963 RepID=UPI00381484FC
MDPQQKAEPSLANPSAANEPQAGPNKAATPAATHSPVSKPKLRPVPPPKTFEQRLQEILAAKNPLEEAAYPLIRAYTEIPAELDHEAVPRLHELISEELRRFKELTERANLKREHILAVQYCLCTAIDEGVLQFDWGQGWWASNSLLVKFHQDSRGGEKFFQVLGRLVENPAENIDVIEVMFILLSMGFQGRYRNHPDGDRTLTAVRQRLYDILLKKLGPVPKEVSPNCKAAAPGRFHHLRGIPVWMSWVLAALVLAGLAGWYKYQLLLKEHDLLQEIAAIGNLARPPSPKALRLEAIGKGDSEPVNDNKTPAARASNRRVEVVAIQ